MNVLKPTTIFTLAAALLLSTACKKADEAEATTENQEEVAEALEGAVDEAVPTTEDGEVAVEGEAPLAAAGEEDEAAVPTQDAPPAAPVEPTGAASAEALVGAWNVDIDSMLASVPAEQREMTRAMMQMMGNLTMTFTAEGRLTIAMGQGQQQSGNYEVTEAGAHQLSATLTSDEGEASNVAIAFLTDDQIRISPVGENAEGEQPMVLNRAE